MIVQTHEAELHTAKTYIPTPGGYTPKKSSDDSKNVPLPKGGSGASGRPRI